jgi:hypothetical protein
VHALSLAFVVVVTAACGAGPAARATAGGSAASAAASSPSSPSSASGSSSGSAATASAGCGAGRGLLPTQSELPGFTQYVEFDHMQVPGSSAPGHPTLFQKQYVCGEFYGFVTNAALTGIYRQENNEQARQLGYPLEKWPYTPLSGPIVEQNKHRVLEIYAGLFQFKSEQAVAQFVDLGKPIQVLAGLAQQQDDHELSVSPLPGSLVTEQWEGTNPSSDELGISVRAPMADYVLTLSIQGGTDLDWNDVMPVWTTINSLLKPLESGR